MPFTAGILERRLPTRLQEGGQHWLVTRCFLHRLLLVAYGLGMGRRRHEYGLDGPSCRRRRSRKVSSSFRRSRKNDWHSPVRSSLDIGRIEGAGRSLFLQSPRQPLPEPALNNS